MASYFYVDDYWLTNITCVFCFRAKKTVPENILKKQQRDAKLLKSLAD